MTPKPPPYFGRQTIFYAAFGGPFALIFDPLQGQCFLYLFIPGITLAYTKMANYPTNYLDQIFLSFDVPVFKFGFFGRSHLAAGALLVTRASRLEMKEKWTSMLQTDT